MITRDNIHHSAILKPRKTKHTHWYANGSNKCGVCGKAMPIKKVIK